MRPLNVKIPQNQMAAESYQNLAYYIDLPDAYPKIEREIELVLTEVDQLRAALRYITQPTMGLPGGEDAEFYCRGVSERTAKLALETCIRIAKDAFDPARRGIKDAVAVGSVEEQTP